MLIIYNIIYIIFFLCYLPVLAIRGKLHRGFLMRLGIFPQDVLAQADNQQRSIWLHTVSVGEAQAARALVEGLQRRYPNLRLVISTVTPSGNSIARKMLRPQDSAVYLPLDIGALVKRAVNLFNPCIFIIAETELWPNLIFNLSRKNIPVVLINGRISAGSFSRYKLIRPFLKQVLKNIALFCVQTNQDSQRIIHLGAPPDRVKVSGNMKFDLDSSQPEARSPQLGLTAAEKLFIAGSTHRGEEEIILRVYKELVESHPNLRLLIAPRHIQRTAEVENLISKFGFESQKVSTVNTANKLSTSNHKPVLILDTIGQLKNLYARAELVFIGGSLIAHGGQNPIEPAIFAKPIIFGPHMSNFSQVAEVFLNAQAAIQAKDEQELELNCLQLLNKPQWGRELGQRASRLIEENRGATFKNLELIQKLIL